MLRTVLVAAVALGLSACTQETQNEIGHAFRTGPVPTAFWRSTPAGNW